MSSSAANLRARLAESTVHAPHLVDAEIGNSLRGMALGGEIATGLAESQLVQLPGLVDERYEHRGQLSKRAWAYRHDVTFYDGLYVALAVAVGCVLVTSDGRLSRAPQLPCRLEVVT